MSDVRVVSPRETIIEVDAHAVPGRPGVVTPGLRVLHDGAVDAATAAASSAVDASGSAGAAASSATAAASSSVLATQKASAAVSAAAAADDAMQAASQAALDADQSRTGAAASAVAAAASEQGAVAAQDGLVLARDAAAGSASSAATSASEAVSSASSAATARSGAETAAATATQKATAAASSATAAATSASNAASSATAAASSATAAASSAASISWAGLPGKPAVIGAGATKADARAAIGAAEQQDTGWRNIASLLDPTKWELFPTGGALRLKRVGSRVTLAGRLRAVVANGDVLTLPAGFVTANPNVPAGAARSGSTLVLVGSFAYADHFETQGLTIAAGQPLMFEVSWETSQTFPIPAAYPGTPS